MYTFTMIVWPAAAKKDAEIQEGHNVRFMHSGPLVGRTELVRGEAVLDEGMLICSRSPIGEVPSVKLRPACESVCCCCCLLVVGFTGGIVRLVHGCPLAMLPPQHNLTVALDESGQVCSR